MIYSKSSVDIIRDVIQSMTFPVTIKQIARTGNIHVLTVCDIYHAQIGREVIIGGNSYTVTDISEGSIDNCVAVVMPTLTVEGENAIETDTFNLYTPFFYHGTARATNIEISKQQNAALKTPMIWLPEIFTDSFFDSMSNLDREIRGDGLIFLTEANHKLWLTDEAYQKAVKPMRRLAEHFIAKLKALHGEFYMKEFRPEFISYAKFGVFIRDNGIDKNLFEDKLAGVRLTSPITVRRTMQCDIC